MIFFAKKEDYKQYIRDFFNEMPIEQIIKMVDNHIDICATIPADKDNDDIVTYGITINKMLDSELVVSIGGYGNMVFSQYIGTLDSKRSCIYYMDCSIGDIIIDDLFPIIDIILENDNTGWYFDIFDAYTNTNIEETQEAVKDSEKMSNIMNDIVNLRD